MVWLFLFLQYPGTEQTIPILKVGQLKPYLSFTESFRTLGTKQYPFYNSITKNIYMYPGTAEIYGKSIFGMFKKDTAHYYCFAQFDSGANITGGSWVDSARWADVSDKAEYLWEYDGNNDLMPTEVVISGDLWMMDLGLDLMPTKNDDWVWDKYWERDGNLDFIPK